ESRRRRKCRSASEPVDIRRACLDARRAGPVEPTAGAPSPSTRSGWRKAQQSPARTTIRCRRATPDVSWRSARNPPFSKASACESQISDRYSRILVFWLARINLINPVEDAALEVEHTFEPDRPQEVGGLRTATAHFAVDDELLVGIELAVA